MNRRSFLKGSLAAGSLIAAPNLLAAQKQAELLKDGKLNTAAHWGAMEVELKGGKVVSSKGLINASKIENPLQINTADMIYKHRIKHCYVRKSYLENPLAPKPELRGSEAFVKVPYEKAVALCAAELKRTRLEKGPSSIFAGSYGWKSIGNMHNCRTLLHRFMNMSGGFTGSLGDYSTGSIQVLMPHVVGGIEVYEQNTCWDVILENSKTVFMWGANPVSTLRISWTADDAQGLMYMEKLKAKIDKGQIKMFIIDPVRSHSAAYFDKATLIKPRPNTDTAMMLGMMHHIYTNKLHDQDFMDTYTSGFDKFLPYLLGQSDKQPKTPAWAAKICDLEEKTIIELAELAAKDKSFLWAGWSLQRAHHGEQAHWALLALACMLGQIGKPGGGFSIAHHYSSCGAPTRHSANISGMNAGSIGNFDEKGNFLGLGKDMAAKGGTGQSWMQKLSESSFPVARIADALLNPGGKLDYNGRVITYPDIDFIYWVGGNPLAHHQDTNRFVKALQKPRTIAVNLPYWTPTAKMADIVFPATTQYERNDISMMGDYTQAGIAPMKQLVDKQYEAKDDYQIFSDLALAYGGKALYDAYTEGGKDEFTWLRQFYATAHEAMKKGEGFSDIAKDFDAFWAENKPLLFDTPEESLEFVKFKDFIEDPILNALGTKSGLLEIYSEAVAAMNYDDHPAHPTWLEPLEWLGMDKKPASFHLVSPHPVDRLHSQQSQTSLRERYAVGNREPVLINSKAAEKLGIKNGDLVRVYNARGEVIAGAKLDPDIREDVVQIYEGAWYDPEQFGKRSICKNGSPNVLTPDIATSKLSGGNSSHTALVDIEKYKGPSLELSAFKEPSFA